MTHKALVFLIVVAASAASSAIAEEFRGAARTRINPVTDGIFEVVASSSSRGADFWCGASDYARRVLKRDWTDRVYVARELGPSVTTNRRSAVHFTVDPDATGITRRSSSLRLNRFTVGDSMSIQQANAQCNMRSGRF